MKQLSNVILTLLLGFLYSVPIFGQEAVNSETADEVYLSFRYKGAVDEIVVAYYDGSRFFLPFTELFDLLAINYELSAVAFSVSGNYLSEGTPYNVDFTRRKIAIADRSIDLDLDDFFLKEVDFYVVPEVYKEVFGLDFNVDLSRLLLNLETKDEMPIVIRKQQRARNELRAQYSQVDYNDFVLVQGREPHYLDGAFADYSLFSTVSRDNSLTNLNLGLGGEVLFGDMQSSLLTTANQDTVTFSSSGTRWRYVNETPYFSSISIGEQGTFGIQNQTVQGIHITNNPITPRETQDNYMIDGTTDPEAEVELYRSNRLIETVVADDVGYYRFLVPLSYGTSEFKIMIYAKQGQIIELDRRVQVPFNFLPRGEILYHLSAGRVASGVLPWHQQAEYYQTDIAIGLKSWLTSTMGLEYIQGNNGDRPAFYSRISSRVSGDLLFALDIVAGHLYKFSGRGLGPNSSSWDAEITTFDKTSLYNPSGNQVSVSSNMFIPFEMMGLRNTGHFSTFWTKRPDEQRLLVKLNINQFFGPLRTIYGLTEQHTSGTGGQTNNSEVQLGAIYILPRVPEIHPLLRGSYLRLDLLYSSTIGRIEELRFQTIRQLNSRMRIQLLSSYNLIQDNSFFEIGFTMDLEKVRSSTSLRKLGSNTNLSQTLRGSVGLDRSNGSFLWDNRQQVGRAGVAIKMYVDEDNSGGYEAGEEIIPGNAVTIQRASARPVSKGGIYRLTQLQPYRLYYFRVNEARLNNPALLARNRKFSVITDPNRYKQVYVPFFTAGVIDGRVERIKAGVNKPMSGLRIHVANEGGSFQTTLRTFGDGSFYSMEIPPGEYEAWVDKTQLEFLGMISTPERLNFSVKADPDGDYIEGLDFFLE